MTNKSDLIYDVGMHNGDDTAYYLHKGYRVVAIEANPLLVEAGEQRFADAIQAGRLEIFNVGVSDKRGEADFYISTELDIWSSLDKKEATRGGRPCETIRVSCLPLADIIRQQGLPFYVKIDVEGSDYACIDGLDTDIVPPFLSIEMSHENGDRAIRRLTELNYRRFRCIRQNDFLPIHAGNVEFINRLRRYRQGPLPLALAVRGVRKLLELLRPPVDPSWRFPLGASGTFGEYLTGPWMSVEEMLAVWRGLKEIGEATREAEGAGEWFDIHAAR
jgi:FkbM family methyltransferase